MRTAVIDARLLLPERGTIPAQLLAADLAGEAALIRCEGTGQAWSEVVELPAAERGLLLRFIRQVPALTVAVVPENLDTDHCDEGSFIQQSFDLVTHDKSLAERWAESMARSPSAALAAILLSRMECGDIWYGLLAESVTYAMLQGAPEFQAWLKDASFAPSVEDESVRVRERRSGSVHELVLSRPQRHNALDIRMRDELHAALSALTQEPDVVVILRGEGQSFCSGGDLGEFGSFADPATAHLIRMGRSLPMAFSELGARMVVGLHGDCIGAGIELAAFAARVIAVDGTHVSLPELSMGLIPGAGGTVSIKRRAGARRFLELLLSSEPVDAKTALGWGLVDEVLPAARLPYRLREAALELIASR